MGRVLNEKQVENGTFRPGSLKGLLSEIRRFAASVRYDQPMAPHKLPKKVMSKNHLRSAQILDIMAAFLREGSWCAWRVKPKRGQYELKCTHSLCFITKKSQNPPNADAITYAATCRKKRRNDYLIPEKIENLSKRTVGTEAYATRPG